MVGNTQLAALQYTQQPLVGPAALQRSRADLGRPGTHWNEKNISGLPKATFAQMPSRELQMRKNCQNTAAWKLAALWAENGVARAPARGRVDLTEMESRVDVDGLTFERMELT